MSIDSYRAFHETVKHRSFRKAAEVLGMAPSSVGRQIAILERQFGTPLFDRSARGAVPTHAGEMVAEFVRDMLLDYDTLRIDLDDYKGGRRALIRIASVEGMVAAGPSEAIAKFQKKFELVRFEVRMVPAPRVITMVKRGEVDLGITFSPPPNSELRTIIRISEPIILVSHDHMKITNTALSLRELTEIPIALPSEEFKIRHIINDGCEAANIKLSPVLVSDSFEILRNFVSSEGGAAILPSKAMHGKDNRSLRITPITDRMIKRTTIDVIALKNRRQSRISRLFTDTLEKTLN